MYPYVFEEYIIALYYSGVWKKIDIMMPGFTVSQNKFVREKWFRRLSTEIV